MTSKTVTLGDAVAVDEVHAQDLAALRAYAAKSAKHAAWVERALEINGGAHPLACQSVARQIRPARRLTESAERSGYAVDKGEDN